MGLLLNLCTPALIYLVFSITQIAIDIFKQENNLAFFKAIVMIIFTSFLNVLCSRGLGIISWIIVFVPFMLMSFITTILLIVFGLDPSSGRIPTRRPMYREKPRHDVENHRRRHRNHGEKKHKKHYDQDFAPVPRSIDGSPPLDGNTPLPKSEKVSPKSPPAPMTTSTGDFRVFAGK